MGDTMGIKLQQDSYVSTVNYAVNVIGYEYHRNFDDHHDNK